MHREKEEEQIKRVTSEFRVDQCDSVYDEDGHFFCKWNRLSDSEKKIVKQNPLSAR